MNSARKGRKVPQPALTLLALMMAIGPFGDTEYTPAMPAIAHSLHAGYGMVQFTMASYLFGSAFSRLLYGPASDRYGRRPVMLTGTAILLLGGLISLLSFNIYPLIGGRLVQGMGACAGGVIADAMVRDAFASDRRQSIYARINAAFALAPAAGPIAGIYVAQWLGWHANFGLLVILALILGALVWFYLPETNVDLDRQALQPKRLGKTYLEDLKTPGFLVYAALSGFCIGVVYTALIGAPDLVLKVLGLGNLAIMIVSVAILVAFVIGAGTGAVLSGKVSSRLLLACGLGILLAASLGLLMVALVIGKQGTLTDYLLPIGVSFIGVGLVVPIATARAMAPFDKDTGTASSLLGGVQMGVAALGTVGMSALHAGTVMDIPIVFLMLSGAAMLLFVVDITWFGDSADATAAR